VSLFFFSIECHVSVQKVKSEIQKVKTSPFFEMLDNGHKLCNRPHISQRKIDSYVYPITCVFPLHKHSNVALVSKNGPALEATRSQTRKKRCIIKLSLFLVKSSLNEITTICNSLNKNIHFITILK
jgi:hypothetical protein